MVRKLEYHQQSSEESRRYVASAAVISGDEKKRKALDGFTHHKLLDRRKREASRRARSKSPHLPPQRPPRADGAGRSIRRVAKEDTRGRLPTKSKDRTSIRSVPATENLETRQAIAESHSISSVARSESNQATRNTGRGKSVDRVSRERFERDMSIGHAHVGESQSQDRSDVLYQVIRKEKAARGSISVAGSRATSKASRLPKNVHRMSVSRNASKASSKTTTSRHSDDSGIISNKISRQSSLSGEVGGPSQVSQTQSVGASLQAKKLHVQTDIQTDSFPDMFVDCGSPTIAALLDPYPSQISKEKPRISVSSQNDQESNDTTSVLAILGEPQTITDKDHPESILPVERLEPGDSSNSPGDFAQCQSDTEESLHLVVPTEPRQAIKRKFDRLLFFRNRSAVSAGRGRSVPRSPRRWRQNSENFSESSLHSEPPPAVERKPVFVDEASIPMNGKAVMNSFMDNASIADSVKSSRSRSWMKLRKSLMGRNSGKQESLAPQFPAEQDCVVLPIVETTQEKKETSKNKEMIQRASFRSPRNKKKLSEKKKSDVRKRTPKNRKSKPDEGEMRWRFPRSPRKSVFGMADTNQSKDLVAVQVPLLLITIDSEMEDAVEAVLAVPSEMIAATDDEDAGPSVASRQSEQQTALESGTPAGHVEGRCDIEDHHEEQDTSLREGEAEKDCNHGKKKGTRGEKLLQELYGGEPQSFDGRSLTRFISSPNLSNNERTNDSWDSKMSKGRRKANRSFSFSEDEDECSEVHSEGHEDECSDTSSYSEDSEDSAEDEQSERSDPYESDQSSCSDVIQNQSNDDSTVSTLSVIKNLKLSRKGNTVNSDISENSAASEWSDMESSDSDEESVSEKDVVQRLLLSKYRKKHR